MKIRQGFVSNSSSSSFIVAFKKKPKSAEEMRKILYGDATHDQPYEHIEPFPTASLADVVFTDMMAQNKQPTEQQMLELLANGHVRSGLPDSWNYVYVPVNKLITELGLKREKGFQDERVQALATKLINEHKEMRVAEAEKILAEFTKKVKGYKIYIFSYSDDNHFGITLEHGSTFNKVEHIRVSHH